MWALERRDFLKIKTKKEDEHIYLNNGRKKEGEDPTSSNDDLFLVIKLF